MRTILENEVIATAIASVKEICVSTKDVDSLKLWTFAATNELTFVHNGVLSYEACFQLWQRLLEEQSIYSIVVSGSIEGEHTLKFLDGINEIASVTIKMKDLMEMNNQLDSFLKEHNLSNSLTVKHNNDVYNGTKKLYENIVNADYSKVINGLVGEWDIQRYEKNYIMAYTYDKDYNIVGPVELLEGNEGWLSFKQTVDESRYNMYRIDLATCFIELKIGSEGVVDTGCANYCIGNSLSSHPLNEYIYEVFGKGATSVLDRTFLM